MLCSLSPVINIRTKWHGSRALRFFLTAVQVCTIPSLKKKKDFRDTKLFCPHCWHFCDHSDTILATPTYFRPRYAPTWTSEKTPLASRYFEEWTKVSLTCSSTPDCSMLVDGSWDGYWPTLAPLLMSCLIIVILYCLYLVETDTLLAISPH